MSEARNNLTSVLEELKPIFAHAAIGDFCMNTPEVEAALGKEKEDERVILFTGVQIMLDVIRERIAQLEEKIVELDEDRARTNALLSSLGEGVIATDNNERIIFTNTTAARALGVDQSKMRSKRFSECVRLTDSTGVLLPKEKHPLLRVLADERQYRSNFFGTKRQHYCRLDDGSLLPVAITITPVICYRKKMIGAIVILRNVSVEHRLDRVKSEFVSLASHQLNTPLSIINLYLESLSEARLDLSEEHQSDLQEIQSAVGRMSRLVDGLLSMSRVELGTAKKHRKTFDAQSVINDLIKELQPAIKEHELTVVRKYDASAKLYSDPELFRIALYNVLDNAVKYNTRGGTITISLRSGRSFARTLNLAHDATALEIRITDMGIGIPAHLQKHVFDKFYRVASAKTRTHGSGLGLSIVKAIVEEAGGMVNLFSQEGTGSTFSIVLPALSSPTVSN